MKTRALSFMPLVARSFAPGGAREAIEAIKDADERWIASAELCLFTGSAEEAVARVRPYLKHDEPGLRLSAQVLTCIACVTLGELGEAQKILEELEGLDAWETGPITGAYCADVVRALLHLPEKDPATLDAIPSSLPEGLRFFLCYVLALREYLRGEHGKAEGIASAALMLSGKRYPIPEIYLHVISTISLMRRELLEEAIGHFAAAWELALPDGLISPFGEHYVLLSGLNKKLIKPELQEKYREISEYADRYFSNWIDIHNSNTDQHVASGLSKMQYTVATLFSRGWSVREIAEHLELSSNTVKRHIAGAYKKLGVHKREQLGAFLLR